MVVDASAIVAILASEPQAPELIDALPTEGAIASALAVYEASVALARLARQTPEEALDRIERFLKGARITLVALEAEDGRGAVTAFARFGKGRHRAGLNMGDCFAYAQAKRRDMPLLFVGSDFPETDIAAALPSV